MVERQIGRVISVDNFRVFIRLEDELTSTYKSGVHDIYEVARINSYLIIPVGSDRIIALITRVKMQEETEFDRNNHSISLPTSSRYITATMLGTIEVKESIEQFIQGVYNFPILDNPVWYVTAKDLDKIFDYREDEEIDYKKDFYLPIGKSPAFTDYDVKICPDQFFVKHAAILGNTGSGKSCTIASILHSIFKHKFKIKKSETSVEVKEKYIQNAHFIIFDTNGEYKDAFEGYEEVFKRINAFHINEVGMKVPYWFMSWDDFDYLFEPGAGTQAPILKRAIGLAKNEIETIITNAMSNLLKSSLLSLMENSSGEIKRKTGYSDFGNWLWKDNNELVCLSKALAKINDDKIKEIAVAVEDIADKDNFNNAELQDEKINKIKKYFTEYIENIRKEQIINDKNIDLPIWFNYQELIAKFINVAIEEHEGSNARISEYLSTLRLRLEGFLNDKRIADPLMLNNQKDFSESLAKFLAFILGDFSKLFKKKDSDEFSKYFKTSNADKKHISQITIIDLALVPYDVLENVTGLIGRLIIEFVSHFAPSERGEYPVVLVLEEAQNYIPEKNKTEKESIAKKVFERIAREGRKYGISLIVSSQRPSELSKTVLSQCNSFFVHRLQNPEDQKYIRSLVSSANSDILDQLPILPQQHAIIMGDCVRTPVQVKISDVDPKPNSDNPCFVESWLKEKTAFPNYKEICDKWKKGE